MKFLTSSALCGLLALGSSVTALSLLEALASYPELSNVYSRINGSPVLAPLLAGADDFTFFAPTNDALDTFLKTQLNSTQDAAFQALIQYSLVKGGFPSVSITETPQFVASNLTDAKYSNVTGGQVLELVALNGQPQVITGNRSVSALTQSDIVCSGGLVHIIGQPLALPAQTVNAITFARLGFFVSILTRGGYLSRATNQYVHQILDSTDVTYFIPNSASALSNFSAKAENWSEEDLRKAFQYHVVPRYVGYSGKLTNGTSLTTAEGTNLTITRIGNDSYVNAAKIIATDYLTSNGVIHVLEDLLDRNNTSSPRLAEPASSMTSSAAATPTISPTTLSTAVQSNTPTSTPTAASPSSSNDNNNLTLKVGLGAGLGGAAFLALLVFIMLLRRRKKSEPVNRAPNRDSSVWDGHSMSTAPSDPKRYFVNRDGVVQQRPQRDSGPPGYQMGMVPVTNLEVEREERDAATRYYSGGSRGSRGSKGSDKIALPMRSPSRLQTNEKGYF